MSTGYAKPTVMHEFYGAIRTSTGKDYRIKTCVKEIRGKQVNKAYSLDKTKLSDGTSIEEKSPYGLLYAPDSYISGSNLLKGVEKSNDPGKKLLEENPIVNFSITAAQDKEYMNAPQGRRGEDDQKQDRT